jgi:hypothetical protein
MLTFVLLAVLADRTFELKRGGFWHRMLIGQPLSEYPEELVHGKILYFYSSGEVGPPSTSVVIESAEIQEDSFGRVRNWLESKGFIVQSGGSKSDRQFRHPNGQSANVKHERHRMVIRISDSW